MKPRHPFLFTPQFDRIPRPHPATPTSVSTSGQDVDPVRVRESSGGSTSSSSPASPTSVTSSTSLPSRAGVRNGRMLRVCRSELSLRAATTAVSQLAVMSVTAAGT